MDGNFSGMVMPMMCPEVQLNGNRQPFPQQLHADAFQQPVWGREEVQAISMNELNGLGSRKSKQSREGTHTIDPQSRHQTEDFIDLSKTKPHLVSLVQEPSTVLLPLRRRQHSGTKMEGFGNGIPTGDKLVLRGLMFHGFHGVKPERKKNWVRSF